MIKKDDKTIVENSIFCNSLYSKATGLRFRKKPINKSLIFTFNIPQKVLMDMWFVFYPIDVVFLDETRKVVEIKEKFLPFTFYNSKNEAKYVIEFEEGVVKKNKIVIGDILNF